MAYGYVRDKEPLGVNWAEISKNFNDRLAADEAERQGKRDDIQKQYDELSQQLIDKPTGADTDLNSAISSLLPCLSASSAANLSLKFFDISAQLILSGSLSLTYPYAIIYESCSLGLYSGVNALNKSPDV